MRGTHSDSGTSAGTVTIADVARVAGVSRQTVSNVLRAPQRVRADTRSRVEDVIAALGYEPNRVAQALRAQASRLIGYRIEPMRPEALAAIHDRFIHALAESIEAADYHLLIFAAGDRADEVSTYQRLYRTGAVDGFVLYGIERNDPRPAALRALGARFATFGRTADGRSADATGHVWVDVDNHAGTSAAVDHLVAGGHRRIGFLGWPPGSAVGDRRAGGWSDALRRHGLLDDCAGLNLRCQDSVRNATRMGGALLDRPDPPTAVVAASDTLAVGVIHAARSRGLVVGRDLAVVGFDDTPTAGVLDLSSVRQPVEAAAETIARALLPLLPAGAYPYPRPGSRPGAAATDPRVTGPASRIALDARLLAPVLVIRGSSAAPMTHR